MNKNISYCLFFIIILYGLIFPGCSREKETSRQSTELKKDTVENKKIEKTPPPILTIHENVITGLTYDVGKLPAGIKYQGKVVAGARWNDKNGLNILILAETEEKQLNTDENGDTWREKELFGYHYIDEGTGPELLWKINDFVKDCPVDITLEFFPGSLTITDLDKDGIAESTFLYKLSCRGDVSPNELKLIMHEGERKFAIRGTTKVYAQGQGPYGGETNVDASFNEAPDVFLNYAKEQWSKYRVEKY